MGIAEGGGMGDVLELQDPTDGRPVGQHLRDAPIVGFKELVAHQDCHQSRLGKVLLGELGTVRRQGGRDHRQRRARQVEGRTRHSAAAVCTHAS